MFSGSFIRSMVALSRALVDSISTSVRNPSSGERRNALAVPYENSRNLIYSGT
jgi:hypothetical protein